MTSVPFPEALAATARAYRTDPCWPDAVRLLAERLTAGFTGRPLLNRMVSEEARWRIVSMLLFLHHGADPAHAGGVTLKQLQDLCARYHFASPGRVAALIALMRVSGQIAEGAPDADRRARPLVPTPALQTAISRSLLDHFAAIDALEPGRRLEARARSEPDFIPGYFARVGRLFFSGVSAMSTTPAMRFFMERDAGHLILMSLWLSDPSGAVPPQGPVQVSFDAIARRFGVSRSHVRRLFLAADAAGYLTLEGPGGQAIRILPPLVEVYDSYASAQLAVIGACAPPEPSP